MAPTAGPPETVVTLSEALVDLVLCDVCGQ